MHIQWLDIIIRFMCISPIQRPHYIPSSYTYQFFEKSYFIIVLHKISCSRQFESSFHCTHWHRFFPLKKAPPLISVFFNGLYTLFGSPVSGGQKPQGRRGKPPSGARNRYAIRLAGHQSPRHVLRDGTALI